MLLGYQVMPAKILFCVQYVQLTVPLSQIISRPSAKAICESCGEEIINGREISDQGAVLCRSCAGEGYYHFLGPSEREQRQTSSC